MWESVLGEMTNYRAQNKTPSNNRIPKKATGRTEVLRTHDCRVESALQSVIQYRPWTGTKVFVRLKVLRITAGKHQYNNKITPVIK